MKLCDGKKELEWYRKHKSMLQGQYSAAFPGGAVITTQAIQGASRSFVTLHRLPHTLLCVCAAEQLACESTKKYVYSSWDCQAEFAPSMHRVHHQQIKGGCAGNLGLLFAICDAGIV
jgi:hypothetical protein